MPKELTVEDILSDESKSKMNLDAETYVLVSGWDSVTRRVRQVPIEYAGCTNKVSEMEILKETIDSVASTAFDDFLAEVKPSSTSWATSTERRERCSFR